MNPITLNLIAVGIFAVVLLILVGPLLQIPATIPALITIGILGIATVDTFGFNGQGGNLLIDTIAQRDPAYRRRILHHEAGHFLVAHLLDIPVTDYTLSAWEASQKGQNGRGGVQFNLDTILRQANTGALSTQAVDTYCSIWMAGIAAEELVYGQAEGGGSDRQQIRLLWSQLSRLNPTISLDTKMRWAILKAKSLLEQHRSSYDALVEKMDARAPIEDCLQVVQGSKQNQLSETPN
ncbi:MAG: ATP-dependent Zn protease [Leptolyngbyaceae bacterium]|nr:ATP-dependent Zn protease [Leptolyngbyaceae bacterium]